MLAHRIKEFIKELSSYDQLNAFDREFLTLFSSKFDPVFDETELNEDDVEWLLKVFVDRWKIVADTDLDYTFNPADENACWVQLAKDLAEGREKNYLQILLSTIENTVDPILLNKLTVCSELRGFYVSQDQKTLHRVRGLFERVQKKHHFSSFKNPSDTTAKALTLMELARIQSKQGEMPFDFERVNYLNFWDYITRAIMPTLSAQGEYPFALLASLLEACEAHFSGSYDEFRTRLRSWEQLLQDYSVEDINSLYGQVIQVSDQSFYLAEILIAALTGDKCSDDKIIGLVAWITQQDPSLISRQRAFDDIYKERGIGPHFTIKELSHCVAQLEDCRTQRGVRLLALLVQKSKVKSRIDEEIVGLVSDVYRERWLKIMGGSKDYTRLQGGVNQAWIKLAQFLAGAGIIGSNYYRFLMPTLTHDNDPVLFECITRFPLSHFILTEDGRQLVLLENSAQRYRVTKTFYNCNTVVAKPFSKIELDRVAFAHKRFQKYLEKMRIDFEKVDPSVLLSTVMAVKALVDGSLYPTGLIFSHNYDETQIATAARAYQVFYRFLHDLPDDERQRLETQRIFFHNFWYTFGEIMLKVKEGECIAVYGQYFAQFVMDYAPYLQFRTEIETQVAVDEMRAGSRKKIVREYDTLTEEEALRRLHVLFVSIMSHSFQYMSFSGYTESHLGYKNIMTYEAAAILEKIMPALEARNFKDARSLYVSIVEGTIKPLLYSDTYYTRATRYADTNTWLRSIVDGTLFVQAKCWYEPEVLLARLLPVLESNSALQSKVEGFLDKSVNLLMRGSSLLTSLHVNMKFMQFLKSLDTKSQGVILEKVNQVGKIERSQLMPLCMKILRLRIANLYAEGESASSYSFFSPRPNGEAFEKAISEITVERISLLEMQDLVYGLLQFSRSDTTTKLISQYWERATGRCLERTAVQELVPISY